MVEDRRSGGESVANGEKGLSDVRRWLRVIMMASGGRGVVSAFWTSCSEKGVPFLFSEALAWCLFRFVWGFVWLWGKRWGSYLG